MSGRVKWSRGIFAVTLLKGPDGRRREERSVEGWMSPDGCWGADRRDGRSEWFLTHIPTGGLAGHFATLTECRALGDAMSRATDCSLGSPGTLPPRAWFDVLKTLHPRITGKPVPLATRPTA